MITKGTIRNSNKPPYYRDVLFVPRSSSVREQFLFRAESRVRPPSSTKAITKKSVSNKQQNNEGKKKKDFQNNKTKKTVSKDLVRFLGNLDNRRNLGNLG